MADSSPTKNKTPQIPLTDKQVETLVKDVVALNNRLGVMTQFVIRNNITLKDIPQNITIDQVNKLIANSKWKQLKDINLHNTTVFQKAKQEVTLFNKFLDQLQKRLDNVVSKSKKNQREKRKVVVDKVLERVMKKITRNA